MIKESSVFIFFDDVQYTKKTWRNRNYLNGPGGLLRLTVPVKASTEQRICDVEIDYSMDWPSKHVRSIETTYRKSKYFNYYFKSICDNIYSAPSLKLSEFNCQTTRYICECLGIRVAMYEASRFGFSGDKAGTKILKYCKFFDCNTMLNGPTAADYLDPLLFKEAGVQIKYINYEFKRYEVPKGFSYTENCSVLDLLFNCGPDASKYV